MADDLRTIAERTLKHPGSVSVEASILAAFALAVLEAKDEWEDRRKRGEIAAHANSHLAIDVFSAIERASRER